MTTDYDAIERKLRENLTFCAEKMRADNEIDGWQGFANVNMTLDLLLRFVAARAAWRAVSAMPCPANHDDVCGREERLRSSLDAIVADAEVL